ncbi:hypothetical protein, partial [Schlesneria sp.]|uniref:hypothetical protein n=1 Tax=Schlesneria sp. TaxID=2762018 RepID=UPI002EFEB333
LGLGTPGSRTETAIPWGVGHGDTVQCHDSLFIFGLYFGLRFGGVTRVCVDSVTLPRDRQDYFGGVGSIWPDVALSFRDRRAELGVDLGAGETTGGGGDHMLSVWCGADIGAKLRCAGSPAVPRDWLFALR